MIKSRDLARIVAPISFILVLWLRDDPIFAKLRLS